MCDQCVKEGLMIRTEKMVGTSDLHGEACAEGTPAKLLAGIKLPGGLSVSASENRISINALEVDDLPACVLDFVVRDGKLVVIYDDLGALRPSVSVKHRATT